jgi:protein-serine/threonine kinase
MWVVGSSSTSVISPADNPEALQRLPAEELSKLRWVKQQSKTSLSHLNDLLIKMEEWKAKGNQRMSLAEGVGAPINDE